MTRPAALLFVGAALLGLALVGAEIATWDAVRAASATLTRGQADLIFDELRVAVGRGMPTSEDLHALLDGDPDDEIAYVALVDAQGDVIVDAGTSVLPDSHGVHFLPAQAVQLTRIGDRVRASYRRGQRRRMNDAIGLPAVRQLVFEFTPRQADALEARARHGIVLAAVGAIAALLLAALYARQRRLADEATVKEEQSRRLAALGQMSAVLAHELRNPLASLKGHAQLLERALPEGEAPRQKAERVVGETVRLERLIDDLLAFVRSGTLTKSDCDLAELVRVVATERGQGRVQIDVKGPLVRRVDPERMRQVLANLVDNAAQSDPGAIEVRARQSGDAVEIAVRDHGAGLADKDLPKIFEPFYTTRTQGTGLGLAICRQIVDLHGGTLTVENAPGGGARFVILLPGNR